MTEMVERVTAAILEQMGPLFGPPEKLADPEWRAKQQGRMRKAAKKHARAAIEAMREPTGKMVHAGSIAVDPLYLSWKLTDNRYWIAGSP